MGQHRTALIFGSTESLELPEAYWDKSDYRKDPESMESGAIGYSFACAYDDSHGCVEIEFPIALSNIEEKYKKQIAAARNKWETWRKRLSRDFKIDAPDGVLFLDQVERA